MFWTLKFFLWPSGQSSCSLHPILRFLLIMIVILKYGVNLAFSKYQFHTCTNGKRFIWYKLGLSTCFKCTNLVCFSSILANLSGIFSNYADQQLYEIITMVTDFSSASRVVIMGDLNCGPSLPGRNIQEEFESIYKVYLPYERNWDTHMTFYKLSLEIIDSNYFSCCPDYLLILLGWGVVIIGWKILVLVQCYMVEK